ncbi:MAG: response regulator [Dechloromonas sp.]|nr:response regulator [Dechloromonas sp.]
MSERVCRVLAADDDPTMGLMFGVVLPAPAFALRFVPDGVAALAAYGSGGDFDIVVLDVEMPGLDGLSVAEMIRRCESELPIVLLSGRADAGFFDAASTLGAHHLPKPVDWAALGGRLRAWLD